MLLLPPAGLPMRWWRRMDAASVVVNNAWAHKQSFPFVFPTLLYDTFRWFPIVQIQINPFFQESTIAKLLKLLFTPTINLRGFLGVAKNGYVAYCRLCTYRTSHSLDYFPWNFYDYCLHFQTSEICIQYNKVFSLSVTRCKIILFLLLLHHNNCAPRRPFFLGHSRLHLCIPAAGIR